MKESAVQKKIIDYLHSVGAWTVKTIQCNKAGVPDILACYKGKFIALEVKRDSKSIVSTLQKRTIKQIQRAKGISAVVTSVEEVKDILDRI